MTRSDLAIAQDRSHQTPASRRAAMSRLKEYVNRAAPKLPAPALVASSGGMPRGYCSACRAIHF
ncbi:hypothetical protein BJF79_23635 [Actinomadura sp. CNU-125]|uniref:hypothetical protein n=1 Tax=Actinomadura sp. CNU-125 TaxID=1904961 RepID=UPI00095FFD5F|nr:hypothetical protein [Actinomadura sp. CNU-125]OLT11717.1 hypothetical protein BJF79_23635 [Actinomadura sp. CNU-125]